MLTLTMSSLASGPMSIIRPLLGNIIGVLGALAILLIGFIVANVLKGLIQKALKSTDGAVDGKVKPSAIAGMVVFWLVMILAIAGAMNALGLGVMAAPLTGMISVFSGSVPRLLAGAAIAFLGWFAAKLLKGFISSSGPKLKLDEGLRRVNALDDAGLQQRRGTQFLAWSAYVLVLFFVLQAAVGFIGIQGLSQPFQNVATTVTSFLPRLAAAAIVGAVAWLVATIVRELLTNVLGALGVNRFGPMIGMEEESEEPSEKKPLTLARAAGHFGFYSILLFAFPAVLDQLGQSALVDPIRSAWNEVLAFIPNLAAAVFVGLIAYAVSRIVGPAVQRLLEGIGFDRILERIGLAKLQSAADGSEALKPSRIVSIAVVAFVVILFAEQALRQMQLGALADLLGQIVDYTPRILIAVVVLGFAFYLGGLVSKLVGSAAGGLDAGTARIMASTANVAVVVFGFAVALTQLDIAPALIQTTVLLLIGAVAVAIALAFGLGGRTAAERFIERQFGGKN
jgi:hypothetical protein